MTKSANHNNNSNKSMTIPERLPRMIVFDLDYTIWPEWIDCTYGPPYAYDKVANRIENKYGEQLMLFKHITAIFTLIRSFKDVKIAIASRTGAPEWALNALTLLRVPELGNTTLRENIDFMEIYPTSKLRHFTALSEKSGIACKDMLFFDDERRNAEVKTLGVHFVHVDARAGVTMNVFYEALAAFDRQARYKQTSMRQFLNA
ncbi:magnesium-dependent phosphatase-1 [Radiomyces spectabilis]|uniref:magnesium-dependent phosphatase-1 n=1 Tax=Radiomyces spectabilis TaxID=64574 RepID=UPI0022204ACB|nr:magnesium-dependent phosphatase-1 [Radiomyces spectabilis]KAI8391033.1 magnesium-dependent phosphatase-1 [Radiomyces spectabilis]